jgi:hypothetical protein
MNIFPKIILKLFSLSIFKIYKSIQIVFLIGEVYNRDKLENEIKNYFNNMPSKN